MGLDEKEEVLKELVLNLEKFSGWELAKFEHGNGRPPLSDFVSYQNGRAVLNEDFFERYLINGKEYLTDDAQISELKDLNKRLRAYNTLLAYP